VLLSKDKIVSYILFTWKKLFKTSFLFLILNFLITTTFLFIKTKGLDLLNLKILVIFYFVINILSLIFILTVMIFHNYSYLMLLSLYPFKSEIKRAKRRFISTIIIYFSVIVNVFLFFNNLNVINPLLYIELLYDYIMKISLLLFILLYITINNSIKLVSLLNLEKKLYKVYVLLFLLEITSILIIYLSYLGLKKDQKLFLLYTIIFSPLIMLSLIKLSKEYINEIKNLIL